ncbi:hypothetical protein DPMN_051245 [Dreissena polymorpha]|uniref:Uncharacterized protein n=1 Tax=Dreissena polymorpha TaxID=45954 RepID=A0A9D4HLZ3_DREPO|nr:hypothetical protein DPMN_051245 [Dreissena polymorpha]
MSINVNTASVLELMQIPGVGEKIATLIVELHSSYGYDTKEVLHLALRGKMTSEVLAMLDFSEPKPKPRNLMDIDCLSMYEDLNAMAAALPSCPLHLNPIPVSTSTRLSVARTQSPWITTTAPIMSSWANPPYSWASWPGLLTQTKPMVRHYSPVKFEDDQGQRSCTCSSRTSSCSPVRTSLQVLKTQKPTGQVESSDHEYGKLGKSSSRSAGQYPTPSSKKQQDSEQSDAGGPGKRTTGSESKITAGGRSSRSPSPSRSYSSKDSSESKSHRKGTTGSTSKITAGGRFYRSPSHSRSKSPEDRNGSSRNRKRTTGSARKSTAGGRSSRSPSFSRSKSPEDRRESSRNRKRTTGSRKRTTASGRSFRSPSSSG